MQERHKQYNQDNKEKIRKQNNKYNKDRRKNDPTFRLRHNINSNITFYLKKNSSFKNNLSILKHLPYNIQEIKDHFETLFAHWMTWENYGKYDPKTWDDHDSSTWTWNIDHIIPQSLLPYTSMEDENFQKCWALDNIRPLSAKQNMLDGVNKTRHNIISLGS